jgi:hypothetical protein
LDGPHGNIFNIFADIEAFCEAWPTARTAKQIIAEMQATSDYYEAIKVADSYFGEYVAFVTTDIKSYYPLTIRSVYFAHIAMVPVEINGAVAIVGAHLFSKQLQHKINDSLTLDVILN